MHINFIMKNCDPLPHQFLIQEELYALRFKP